MASGQRKRCGCGRLSVLVALAALSAAVAGCQDEALDPDGEWDVTVAGASAEESACSQDSYEESFTYQLFYEGSATEIRIADEGFANGLTSGCSLEYESAVWLEEAEGGIFQWQITGQATVQGAAGGCDLPEGLDWEGTETLTVVYSENESVPEGCTYPMAVSGAYVGG